MKTLFLVFVIALALATALSVTRKSWQSDTAFMNSVLLKLKHLLQIKPLWEIIFPQGQWSPLFYFFYLGELPCTTNHN